MKNRLSGLLIMLFVSVGAHAQTPKKPSCLAPETILGSEAYDEYNQLVCAGSDSLRLKKYSEAAGKFQAALKLDLYDVPNFQSLTKLALAYHLTGQRKLAEQYLMQSELALKVLVGEVRCVENSERFYLSDIMKGKLIVSPAAQEVAARMCGGAYDSYYQVRTLSGFLSDAVLVKQFFEVREKILGK